MKTNVCLERVKLIWIIKTLYCKRKVTYLIQEPECNGAKGYNMDISQV
jgi:hypothetical protein